MLPLFATLLLSLLLFPANAFATEGGGSTYVLGGRDAFEDFLPQRGEHLRYDDKNHTVTGKYYKEFNARNWFEGSSAWLSLIASF